MITSKIADNPSHADDLTSHGDDSTSDRFRIVFTAMFWLSAILAVLTFTSAIFIGYQNYVAAVPTGGALPTYIPLLIVLVVCCSLGLAFSSTRWRQRRARPAILSFIASIVTLVLGPYALLLVRYGAPK